MPFITVKIVPPARLVAKRFERLRRKIPLVALKRLYDAAVAIRHTMKEPGAPISYPVHWDSVKQRKAFFASDGFGRGIPTKRTDEYIHAWQVIKIANGYDVGNPLSHARYIGGTPRSIRRQSRIHRGRWNLLKPTIDRVIGKLPKKVRESLKITARREGFRTKD
jgi:hypothetical protein